MNQDELLWKLEGLHTVESAQKILGFTRQSAINLLSKLKKKGYVLVMYGRNKPRLYKITQTKQRPRNQGMFDILNKYSPNFQLMPWYDHQVHGHYDPEEALVDAIETGSSRAILASLHLFNHITSWPKLYRLAKERQCWQKVGALYDVAKMHFRVKRMLKQYYHPNFKSWKQLTQLKNRNNFPSIQEKWRILIPFNDKDILTIK